MGDKEQSRRVEIDPLILEAYSQIFINRFDCYPVQKPDGQYVTVPRPLHESILRGHLKGHITVGAYALNAESMAKWLVLDADDDPHWLQLLLLARKLQDQDIPSYPEPSRRGGHLWLFFDPLPGKEARRLGKQLMTDYHIDLVELYPKQDVLRPGPGSLVRLPFGIHQLNKRRYPFLTPDNVLLAPTIREQIALLTQPHRVPQPFIAEILKHAPEPQPVSPTPSFIPRPKNRIVGETPSERIKNRVSVYEFVSQFVPLDNQGKGKCPFHDDQVQSFQVNLENNYWNCYAGCGGGSVIDFWMKWRHLNGQDPNFTKTIIDLIQIMEL